MLNSLLGLWRKLSFHRSEKRYAVVIFDAFSGHNSDALNELLEDNKILVVRLPNGCTDELSRIL